MPSINLNVQNHYSDNQSVDALSSNPVVSMPNNLGSNNLMMPSNNNWQIMLNMIQQLLSQLMGSLNKPKEVNLNNAQAKNTKALFNTNLEVKAQDSNKDGCLNVGDTLVFSDTHNRTYETKISSNDMLKAIRGDYGKALNVDLQGLSKNLSDQNLLNQELLGVVFDKNNDGKLSVGDVAVTYALKPQIDLPAPGTLVPIWYLTDTPKQFIQLTSEHLKGL